MRYKILFEIYGIKKAYIIDAQTQDSAINIAKSKILDNFDIHKIQKLDNENEYNSIDMPDFFKEVFGKFK